MHKVSCDKCGAKYSLAESRTAGRVLKIRCKACRHVFEVRGDAERLSVATLGKKHWFVAIKRKRVGPLTAQDVREKLASGEATARSYAWRRGMKSWQRITNISEFSEIVAGSDRAGPSSSTGMLIGGGKGGAVTRSARGPVEREPTLPLIKLQAGDTQPGETQSSTAFSGEATLVSRVPIDTGPQAQGRANLTDAEEGDRAETGGNPGRLFRDGPTVVGNVDEGLLNTLRASPSGPAPLDPKHKFSDATTAVVA